MLLLCILMPIHFLLSYIAHILYGTFICVHFIKNFLYGAYNGNLFSDMWEFNIDHKRFERFDKVQYNFFRFWLYLTSEKLIDVWLYMQKDRDKVYTHYLTLLAAKKEDLDKPKDVLRDEFDYESSRVSLLRSAWGRLQAPFYYWLFNTIDGTLVRYRFHNHDHFYSEPFFFGIGLKSLYIKNSALKNYFARSFTIFNFFLYYFINISKKLKWFYDFFSFYIFCWIFYFIYIFSYIFNFINIIWISLIEDCWIIWIHKIYYLYN